MIRWPMATTNFIKVGRVEDFQEGIIRAYTVDEAEVGVVTWEGGFYAFQNRCTHQGNPLDEGGFIGPTNEIICTWHFACFDLQTGRLTDGPAYSGLSMYDVRVEDGDVLVDKEPRPE